MPPTQPIRSPSAVMIALSPDSLDLGRSPTHDSSQRERDPLSQ
jgi:hypothetical protein